MGTRFGGAAATVVLLASPLASARLASASVTPLTWVLFDVFVTPTRTFLAIIFSAVFGAIASGLVFLFVLFLVRALVRKEWLAGVLFAAVFSSTGLLGSVPASTRRI